MLIICTPPSLVPKHCPILQSPNPRRDHDLGRCRHCSIQHQSIAGPSESFIGWTAVCGWVRCVASCNAFVLFRYWVNYTADSVSKRSHIIMFASCFFFGEVWCLLLIKWCSNCCHSFSLIRRKIYRQFSTAKNVLKSTVVRNRNEGLLLI